MMRREMTIAEKVSQFRREAKLSQAGLAEKSGVSQQLISQIENGRNATTRHLTAIARALGRRLTEFDPSLVNVLADDDFPERYLSLEAEDRLSVQALIEKLERDRARQATASPPDDPQGKAS